METKTIQPLFEDCLDFEDEAIDAPYEYENESETMKEYRTLVNQLTIEELEDVLLYVKTISKARNSNGRVKPPSAELWERLPYWLKLKIYLTALFYEKVYKLKKKLWLN